MLLALNAGCAATPWVVGGEPFQITQVEVTRANDDIGTVNLVEDVRVKTLMEASKYAGTGRETVLSVRLDEINFKNPALTYVLGDSNRLKATITLEDAQTEMSYGEIEVLALDRWLVQGTPGALLTLVDNPIDIEQRLAGKLAARIFERIYGTKTAEKVASRKPTIKPETYYPTTYARLKRQRYCRILISQRSLDPAERGGNPMEKIPEDCKGLSWS